jgi:hypothetical protein
VSVAASFSGAGDLYRVAAAAREAGRKDLGAQLNRSSHRAGRIVEDEIRRSTDTYIPRGFEQRFRQNLETKTEVRLANDRRITVVVGARGKSRRRHVRQMNDGDLRHPVFARSRRLRARSKLLSKHPSGRMPNPWVGQKIRPGLVTEPGMRAMPAAKAEIHKGVGRVAAKLGRAG